MEREPVASQPRYGPPGFVAMAVNVLVLEFLTWVLMLTAWFFLPLIALPVIIVDVLVAWALTRRGGFAAQIGRGMALGCLAPMLTMLLFIPGWIISNNFSY